MDLFNSQIVLLFILLFAILAVNGDVIFTSERCNRVTYGLRTVNGDPTRYKQCGPSGRVWIVPCAPQMTFDPNDRVCKERSASSSMKPMRKYETHPEEIITTPAPITALAFSPPASSPSSTAEEFVFSTIRPKRPKSKKTRKPITKKVTVSTVDVLETTTPKIVIFAAKKAGPKASAGPAFPIPGRLRTITTTTTVRPVTHATQFVPIKSGKTVGPRIEEGRPHILEQYQRQRGGFEVVEPMEEPLTTMVPEYTVRYNGKSMTENEFLNQLLHIVQHQKSVADRIQQENFHKMEKDRLEQEKIEKQRAIEKRRQLEEAEKARRLEAQRQAAILEEQERVAMEREREIERIRQEERRMREIERKRQEELEEEMERMRLAERMEQERKKKNERIRQELEAVRKAKEREREIERNRLMEIERREEMERKMKEEEEERRLEMERIQEERNRAILEEQHRREVEEKRRHEYERELQMEREEQKRKAAEQQAQFERMEREREMVRQLMENEERMRISQQNIITTPLPVIQPIYRPQISEYKPPDVESQMIRFTTQTPEWVTSSNSWKSIDNWGNSLEEVMEPTTRKPEGNVYQGCEINGRCELRYDMDSFCTHPTDSSKYLQCAPLHGRHGQWTERQCPDTLEFLVSVGRCEKSRPYDPDNRVVIPRLPSETSFVQWKGNQVIDNFPTSVSSPRVYPPVPETHQPNIYNTIEKFPKDLLPRMPEQQQVIGTPEDLYAQQYQNHIHGSVISPVTSRPPQPVPQSYNIPQENSIDLSNIHPLFPRVQPDFLSRFIPALNWKFHDEQKEEKKKEDDNPPTIESVVKPVLKQLALNHTQMFLDRLLSDDASLRDEEQILKTAQDSR